VGEMAVTAGDVAGGRDVETDACTNGSWVRGH
jgi:hypothetical protein